MSPGCLGPPLPPFSRWCPSKDGRGDTVAVHAEDMTKPTEQVAFDLKYHTRTLNFLVEFVIRDLVVHCRLDFKAYYV